MKNFNSRVVSLVIALLFILNSTVYGIDLSDKTKTHLRVQLTGSTQEGQKRQIEALAETYHEHVNAYIEPQARARYEAFLKGREDTPENRVAFYNNLPTYNGIAVMEIEGLYDNTALLDHGGQGQFYGGRQIIYLEKGLTQEEKDYILAHVHGEGLMWRVQMTKDGFAGRPAEWRSHLIADYGHYQDLERQFDEDAPEVPEEILAKYRRIAEGTGLLEMIAELPRKDVVIAAGGKLSRRGFVKGLGGVLGALALTPKKILIDALGESATDARQGATGEVLADLNRVPEDGESPVVPAQNWGPVTSPNGEFKAYAFSTYPENPYDIWLVIEDVATGSELSRTKIGNQIRGDGVYSIQWTTDSEHVVLETSLRFAYPLSTERSGVLVVTPGGNVIVNVDAYQDGKPIINTELIFTDTDLALTYKKAIYHGPPYPGGDPYYTYEGPYTEVFRFTLGAENASFVFAGHAYVRQGYNLVVTDVNTGEVVSVYDTGYTIYGLRSQGDNYLYVLNAQEEIEIVDISDPNNLQRVGAITIPESERLIMYDDFILDGDVAYGTRFVDAEGGPGMYIGDLYLDIYDLTDPTQPQLVSEYHIGSFDNRPKYGRGFISKVDENHVVVDVSRNGIRILDISNPDAIAQVGSIERPFQLQEMVIHEGRLYLARTLPLSESNSTVYIYELAEPSNPALLGTISFDNVDSFPGGFSPGAITDMTLQETNQGLVAFLTATKNGLMAISVEDPANPSILSILPLEYNGERVWPNDVDVMGDLAYVTPAYVTGGNLLYEVDISDPSQPVVINVYEISEVVPSRIRLPILMKGSVLGLMKTLARLGYGKGDRITIQDIKEERYYEQENGTLSDRRYSETTVWREFRDAEDIGLVRRIGKDEDGNDVYLVLADSTSDQLRALESADRKDLRTKLDRGRVRPEERADIREGLQEESIGIELTRVPGKGEDAPEETWSRIKLWAAESVVNKGRSRFATWLATKLAANETVVIIARDADEYRDVEYLKYDERIHIKVVYGDTPEAQEAVDNLGLKPYQIIKDKTPEQLSGLFRGLIIYGENGIDLKTLNDTIKMRRELAEDIANGV